MTILTKETAAQYVRDYFAQCRYGDDDKPGEIEISGELEVSADKSMNQRHEVHVSFSLNGRSGYSMEVWIGHDGKLHGAY